MGGAEGKVKSGKCKVEAGEGEVEGNRPVISGLGLLFLALSLPHFG